MARHQFKIGGMHCSFCSQSIERAYKGTEGVQKVSVSLAHEEALIEYDEALVDAPALEDVLRDVGYTIRDPDKARAYEQQEEELASKRRSTLQSGIAAGLVAAGMVAMWLGVMLPAWGVYVVGALAAWVIFWVGGDIVRMALAGLRRRIFNQHVLLFVGAAGGFAAGILGLFDASFPAFHFFGAAIFLMTYHLLSGWVATMVRARSQEAVRKLLDLRPDTARRIVDGEETEVPVDEVRLGERIRVKPGESIPLDGKVVGGRSTVDESIVTGEPIPTEKGLGDEVIGGSINQVGTLVVEVTAVGAEGFLQQVARHVEEARAMKPGVLVLVDWILKFYVPGVLLTGIAAFLFWSLGSWVFGGSPDWTRAIFAMLTVYVMGYPCALGMATPLALVRGGGLAASRGILMRSAEAFQVFKDVDVVVLDKTGTITEGRPFVVRIAPTDGESEREVLRLAAIAEQASEHPLADAIVSRARAERLELPAVDDFEADVGRGVIASLNGHEFLVGTPKLLEERGIDTARAIEVLGQMRAQGQTAVLVAAGGMLKGVIGIADRIKDGSGAAIRQLREIGVESVMLTGDSEQAARAVAQEVGIDRVVAEVLPGQKAEEIGRLQDQGHRVAMVGDGINDAPALTRADVGVAIGAGTDIALESADVVLIHSRLSGVVAAFDVSRNSYRKTKQNLALAFAFNGIGVPLATTGLVHPVWAMLAMVGSVSLVLANSFGGRLIRGEAEKEPGVDVAARKEAEAGPVTREEEPSEEILLVPGIHCDGCALRVHAALMEHEAVEAVDADAHTGIVRVRLRRPVSESELAERISAVGFEVR